MTWYWSIDRDQIKNWTILLSLLSNQWRKAMDGLDCQSRSEFNIVSSAKAMMPSFAIAEGIKQSRNQHMQKRWNSYSCTAFRIVPLKNSSFSWWIMATKLQFLASSGINPKQNQGNKEQRWMANLPSSVAIGQEVIAKTKRQISLLPYAWSCFSNKKCVPIFQGNLFLVWGVSIQAWSSEWGSKCNFW